MRCVSVLLALLLVAPLVAAGARTDTSHYVVAPGQPARFYTTGAGSFGVNGAAFFPAAHETSARLIVHDASGLPVALGVCHEWTHDDGSHVGYGCEPRACATQTVALRQPPGPGIVYRLLVFVFSAPYGCASSATTGEITARLT